MLPPESRAPADRDWVAIAHDYAAGSLTIAEICALHGISARTLYRRAAHECWEMRQQPGTPSRDRNGGDRMAARLLYALDKKMTEFENRMAQSGTVTAADSERDARTLNTLVRLFEKLKGFGSQGEARTKPPSAQVHAVTPAGELAHDADRLRHDLAQRLERLRESLRG